MSGAPLSLGIAALVTTAALWGSNHVVARAVRDTIPLPSLVFWRWFVGATLLTLIAIPALKVAAPRLRRLAPELAVGGVIGVGVFSFLLLGGAYHSLALEVGLINATTPIWVAVLGAVLGTDRLSARGAIGLSFALAGTLVITARGDPSALARLQFGFGNLLSLLAAISFAWFSLRVRVWAQTIDTMSITVVTAWSGILLVMLPVYLVAGLMTGHWFVQPGADLTQAAAAIGYMAIGPTMLGNLFYLYGVAATGPARAATFLYLSPVFSALFAIGFLDERLEWFHFFGVAVIAAGLWLVMSAARTRSRGQT